MKKSDKNSIDPDKVAENPGLLPYAHHVGSAIIKPLDKGRTKGNAMSAMYQQTDVQLLQIKEQVELLINQAQQLHDRISISERIYEADCGFKPVVGQIYHVYQKKDDSWVLSMITPDEWGSKSPYMHIAEVKMMGDHTWEILKRNKDVEI